MSWSILFIFWVIGRPATKKEFLLVWTREPIREKLGSESYSKWTATLP